MSINKKNQGDPSKAGICTWELPQTPDGLARKGCSSLNWERHGGGGKRLDCCLWAWPAAKEEEKRVPVRSVRGDEKL